jgi:hypothetical protein
MSPSAGSSDDLLSQVKQALSDPQKRAAIQQALTGGGNALSSAAPGSALANPQMSAVTQLGQSAGALAGALKNKFKKPGYTPVGPPALKPNTPIAAPNGQDSAAAGAPMSDSELADSMFDDDDDGFAKGGRVKKGAKPPKHAIPAIAIIIGHKGPGEDKPPLKKSFGGAKRPLKPEALPPKHGPGYAKGGRVRGCGVESRGNDFKGIY